MAAVTPEDILPGLIQFCTVRGDCQLFETLATGTLLQALLGPALSAPLWCRLARRMAVSLEGRLLAQCCAA